MRVKFDKDGYRWLRVRNAPSKDAEVARMIERGCEFDVDGEPENGWYHVNGDYPGYVMAEFVTPLDEPVADGDDGALQKMKVAELRKLAEESGVKLKPNMKKADIIEALLNG